MQNYDMLKTNEFFNKAGIDAHLEGVEYIIMAAPTVLDNARLPIHFTIFLNTTDILPEEIKEAILKKFCEQYNITAVDNVESKLASVAFAKTNQDTPMPMYLVKQDDRDALEHTTMHVIDFLGDSPEFKEPKEGATGWSYSYV